MNQTPELFIEEVITNKIHLVRGLRVMFDDDLAELYKVPTKVLNQAVRRNLFRFPEDFMFQLSDNEFKRLRSQFVTSNVGRGGRRSLPYAFTEHGVAMLSSILNSEAAILVNIQIIRIFSKMRELMMTHKDILLKLEQMEQKVSNQDEDIQLIFQYLKELLNPPQEERSPIGFKSNQN
jgi:hypothetical protein